MRIAVLIIGLLMGLLLFIQSWTVGALGEFADASGTTENAGGAGLLMAFGWLFACALVIPFPLVSAITFAVTVPIGLLTPTGEFGDLRFHGTVAIALTIMSFFGWRGKRKRDEENREERERQEARDKRLESLLVQHQPTSISSASNSMIQCPTCRHMNGPSARFCEECGTPVVQASATSDKESLSKLR